MKMKDAKIKWHVIKSAIKLREIEKYKGTYIHSDLTDEQRKQEFQLRAELKKKRSEDPEGKYIIKSSIIFIQQKMKNWSHTAEFKLLAFSAVTANMLDFDLFEKVCIFVVWLGRFAPFAK